jgi:hypothetical protein
LFRGGGIESGKPEYILFHAAIDRDPVFFPLFIETCLKQFSTRGISKKGEITNPHFIEARAANPVIIIQSLLLQFDMGPYKNSLSTSTNCLSQS